MLRGDRSRGPKLASGDYNLRLGEVTSVLAILPGKIDRETDASIAPFAVEAAKATAHLLRYLELGDGRSIPVETAKAGDKAVVPAEEVLARAFNLWMYETVRHPERFSHEADDVAAFRRQSALGIEPRYGVRASANLLQFLEQAQVAA